MGKFIRLASVSVVLALLLTALPTGVAQAALPDDGFKPSGMFSVDRQNEDGTHTMIVYQNPINYFDGSEWKPIDTTITKIGDIYGVETGVYQAYFYEDHVEVVRESGTTKIYFLGTSETSHEKTTLDIDGNKATYRNGVDVEYVYTPSGLKQNVILRHRPEIDGEYYVAKSMLVFDEDVYASVGGRRMGDVFTAQDGVTFKNQDDEVKSIPPPPYSFEYESPEERVASEYEVTIDGDIVYLNVSCPMSWLCDPERSYPVVIDATDDTATNNADAELREGSKYTNYGSAQVLYQGYTTSYLDCRIIMDWTLPSGSGTITEISLNLYKYSNGGTASFNQEVHECCEPEQWTESGACWQYRTGTTYWTDYNYGGYPCATVVDEIPRTATSSEWHTWYLMGSNADNPMSITWGSNFDIVLLDDYTGTSNNYETFSSKEYTNVPYLRVTYTPLVPPSVTTNDATNIQANSAQLNGNLTDLGGASSCDVWFEWGETTAYGNSTTHQEKSSTGAFNDTISGLDSGKTYHFRACASNAGGTSYGSDKSFTTLSESTLQPSDDAAVSEALPTKNYGSNTSLYIRTQSGGNNQRSFLKFDLSSIPSGSTISEAKLHLYCYQVASLDPPDSDIQARKVTDDTWTEGEITWNTQPSHGDVIDTQSPVAATWQIWTVTSYIQGEFAGNGIASLCMRMVTESSATARQAIYWSKEYLDDTTLRPKLVVTYTPPTVSMEITVPTGKTNVFLQPETANQSLISTTGSVTSNVAYDVTAVDKMEVSKATADAGHMVEWTGSAWVEGSKLTEAVKAGSDMTTYGQTAAALSDTAITIISGAPAGTGVDSETVVTITTVAGDIALFNGNWYKITITFTVSQHT